MKKIIKFVIFILLFCLVVGIAYNLFFKVDKQLLAYNSISEIRYNYFTGNDDLSYVNLSSGYRENPYVVDGIHQEMVPFGVLVFRTTLYNISEPSYTLKIDDVKFEGVMERNPLDGTYVCDVENFINAESKINVEIKIEDKVYNFELVCQSNTWNIDAENAFKIAINRLDKSVDRLMHGKEFQGESYVKIVTDPNNRLDIYYWYVSVIDRDGKTMAVVIDSHSGEVLSINQ